MKNIYKITISVILTLTFSANFVTAANISDAFNGEQSPINNSAQEAGYNTETNNIDTIIAIGINFFFGLLGAIFMINLIMAGFDWVMAGGNDEKVKACQDKIRSSIIGLLAVIFAYGIAYALTGMVGLALKP